MLCFLFYLDGGYAKDLCGGIGGIIIGATVCKVWNTDFSTTSAIADTGVPVPEPTSIWLLGSALVGFAGLARRKQRK